MSRLQTKLTKPQYQALLKRVLERQQAGPQQSSYGSMQPQQQQQQMQQPPPEMMQGAPPMGAQQQQPQDTSMLPQQLAASQQMWQGIKGTPGEQVWNMIHGNSSVAQGTSPEDYFHNEMTKNMSDPLAPQGEDEKSFVQSLAGHFSKQNPEMDPHYQAIQQAMMKGVS